MPNIATGSTLLATYNVLTGSALAISNFGVSINWQDGNSNDTTHYALAISGTQVQVKGTHTYVTGGQFLPTVTLTYLPTNTSVTATPTINVATEVTSQTSITKTAPGRIVSRSSAYYGDYASTLTVKNTGAKAINGSLEILLSGLSGATLAGATLTIGGQTYTLAITLDTAGDPVIFISQAVLAKLAPGTSVAVSLYFNDPAAAAINYAAKVFSDPFDI